MHSGFICQSIAGRKCKGVDTILYLDPGFPVNKLQTKFLGLQEESIDLFQYTKTNQGPTLVLGLKGPVPDQSPKGFFGTKKTLYGKIIVLRAP